MNVILRYNPNTCEFIREWIERMPSSPRVITVDPTWTVARIVRSAMDLIDRAIIQIDVPSGSEALEEVERGGIAVVISDVELSYDMKGFELAMRINRDHPDLPIIILAESDDPQFDEETLLESPYIYMQRPVDMQQFVRVLSTALEGKNKQEVKDVALKPPTMVAATMEMSFGPVPTLDTNAAIGIINKLGRDLGAMAIIISTRVGEVVLADGAAGYVDSEKLARALIPQITTTLEVKDMLGGQASTLQYYDGDTYDIFVLSVGLHHYMSVVFPGESGGKQFGPVTRFARRAAEDLIALLGANAWFIQPPTPIAQEAGSEKRKRPKPVEMPEEQDLIPIEPNRRPSKAAEPEKLTLEPIVDLDLDKLFGADVNVSQADTLFDLDALEKIAAEKPKKSGTLGWDDAIELGLVSGE
jgi:DNA-binding NarL/FixJ family response regulator